MGEAKAKREATRQAFIKEAELWASPATAEEAAMVARIEKLNFHSINRAPPEQLAYMRMQPQECHANVNAYVKLDPEGKSQAITGWWKTTDGTYVAHSVVGRDGGMACVTPHHIPMNVIEFAPDPEIEWVEDGEVLRPRIGGKPIPRILRSDPEKTIGYSLRVLERLKTMKNPFEAVDMEMD